MSSYRQAGGQGQSQYRRGTTASAGEGSILDNIFFLATISVTIFIVVWILLRIIAGFVKRCSDSVTCEIRLYGGIRSTCSEDDKLYHSLLKILDGYLQEDYRNRIVNLQTKQLQNGKEEYSFSSPPGYGVHHVWTKEGSWIRVERQPQPELVCQKVPLEWISLSTYKWNRAAIYNLLTEAKEAQRRHAEQTTAFYSISWGDWNAFGEPKRRRLLDSVITANGIKEALLADVKEFLNSEKWYMTRGIPYKRGYLLHGPPGTGKSSLIRAIAGEIGHDICILSLSAKDLTDDELNRLMNCTPEKSIILLEDIDAAFKSRHHLAYDGAGSSKVTFRGLLNALDGVASTEGRITFITTNHVDKLDPALIRPGRVDFKVLVDYPSREQIVGMFKRFYPKAKEEMADTFLHVLMGMDKRISMAAIQGLFLMFKRDPALAIERAEEWLNEEYFGREYKEKEDEEEIENEEDDEEEEDDKCSISNGISK